MSRFLTMSVQLALTFSLLLFLPLLAGSCPVTLITCGGGSLINFTWPFTTDPDSKCRGGYLIPCYGSTPMSQFDVNGLQYVVEFNIQRNILTIRDPTLSKLMQGSHCSFLYEFTEPYPRLDHAHSIPYLASKHGTFFNCSPRDYDFSRDIFDGLNNITHCEGYNLHYLYRSENQQVDSILPQSCKSSSPPYFEWRFSFEEGSGELSLKSAGFSQQLGLYKDCFHCHIVFGRCTNDTVVGDDGCRCGKSCSAAQNVTRSIVKKVVIGVGVGGGILVMCFICCIWYYRRRIMQQPSSSSKFLIQTGSCNADQEMCSNSYRTHVFSYSELHEATNGFDESRELGDGGFGTVYKGQLRDGRVVAVKRLYENNYKRVEQFLNEVDILSRLRHKNLVTLYGCTSRHSRELLLVYEFVANGTVADHLHGPRVPENGLTWGARLNIAIETADALAYLHAIEPQIIHRDVKTNNILLDNSFHVKVADFGLSRLFPVDATHVSTLPQGTPGYVDPEYHQCYQLTDKSDVYSFGVVLVELISSMPAVDISRHRHEINLANLAVTKIQNREIEQLVDPRLAYREDWEIEKMINMVAELAFRCLQGDRDMRPTIKEVLVELKQIENKGEKVAELGEIGDDARLLKSEVPYSPDTVTLRWDSKETTPNTSA